MKSTIRHDYVWGNMTLYCSIVKSEYMYLKVCLKVFMESSDLTGSSI